MQRIQKSSTGDSKELEHDQTYAGVTSSGPIRDDSKKLQHDQTYAGVTSSGPISLYSLLTDFDKSEANQGVLQAEADCHTRENCPCYKPLENITRLLHYGHTASLRDVCCILRCHYIFREYLEKLKKQMLSMLDETMLQDQVQKELGIQFLSLCIISFGSHNVNLLKKFKSKLIEWLKDPNQPLSIRKQVAIMMGCFAYVKVKDFRVITDYMNALYKVFSGAILKDGEEEAKINTDLQPLHIFALKSWSLLFDILPKERKNNFNFPPFHNVLKLLDSSSQEMKLAAGETLVMNYKKINELIKVNEQSESFQQLMNDIEKGSFPAYSKEVNGLELTINSWYRKCHFDFLTIILGTGIQTHLQDNPLLKKIFDLQHAERKYVKDKMGNWAVFAAKEEEDRREKLLKKMEEDVNNKDDESDEDYTLDQEDAIKWWEKKDARSLFNLELYK